MTKKKEEVVEETGVVNNSTLKMNFSIHTPLLLSLVSQVERAAARATTIDILRGIYLEIKPTHLLLRTMNADYGTEVRVEKEQIQVGKKTIPNFELDGEGGAIVIVQKNFKSIISKLPAKTANFKVDGPYVTLSGGRSIFNIVTLDGDDYPLFPEIKKASVMEFIPEEITKAYEQVVIATATSESRPLLRGVNHVVDGDNLFFIATDSHILSRRMIQLEEGKGAQYMKKVPVLDKDNKETGEFQDVGHSITIPETSIQEVIRQVRSVDRVKLSYDDNMAIYQLDNLTMFTRLIEGSYPKTERLIPKEFTTEIRFFKKDLQDLVDRSLLVFETGVTTAELRAVPNEGKFRLTTSEQQSGSAFEEDLATVQAAGEPVHIATSLKQLMTVLKTYDDDMLIKIQMISGVKPIIISSATQEEDHDLSLLLPTRIQSYDKVVKIDNFKAPVQMTIDDDDAYDEAPVAEEPVAQAPVAETPVAEEQPAEEVVVEQTTPPVQETMTPPVEQPVQQAQEPVAPPVQETAPITSAANAFAALASNVKVEQAPAVAVAPPVQEYKQPQIDPNNPFGHLMQSQPNQPQANAFVSPSLDEPGE